MTIVVILLAIFILGSAVISGYMHSRQQNLLLRESQLKKEKETFDELSSLFSVILKIDDTPDIAQLISTMLQESNDRMLRLNKKDQQLAITQEELRERHKALQQGTLKPQAVRVVENDTTMRSYFLAVNQIAHRMTRRKVRGQLSAAMYENYALHLKRVMLEVEMQSHLKMAEDLENEGDNRTAARHVQHARDALKRSSVEVPDRNEQIRQLTDRMRELTQVATPKAAAS